MSISSRRFRASSEGFTLIELMVVISIMVIVTVLVLIQQSRFDSATLLRSLAYSVALSVRQAQVYGSSVLGTTTLSANCVGGTYAANTCYASAYGVHFSYNSPTTYLIFADLANNGMYASGEAIDNFSINNGYIISNLCVTQISPSQQLCASAGALSQLNIVFHRPNPEACFSTDAQPNACLSGGTQVYSQAIIELENPGDPTNTRHVTVTQTGEIAVCSTDSNC